MILINICHKSSFFKIPCGCIDFFEKYIKENYISGVIFSKEIHNSKGKKLIDEQNNNIY